MQEIATVDSRSNADVKANATSGFWVSVLPWSAVFIACTLYGAHFFFGGGISHRILDSWAYLQMSEGQQVGVPFNTRILASAWAALFSATTGLSTSTAFNLLTPVSLLGSALVLQRIILKRNGTNYWQAAVTIAFASSLAVTFGYTPVLLDPLLLLFVCLTIAALDAGHFAFALCMVVAATLTKEYGVVLGVVWAFHAYRRGLKIAAWFGLILPALALLILVFTRQSDSAIGMPTWPGWVSHLVFEYHLSVFRLRGPADYSKLVYLWSWCAVWPILIIGISGFFYRHARWSKITTDQGSLAIMLSTLPILLLGDWIRSLIVLVPFACIVATAHPLARDRRFAFLLALGGLSTALARPFHGATPPPYVLTVLMTIVSAACSLGIVLIFSRYLNIRSAKRLAAEPIRTAGEAALQ